MEKVRALCVALLVTLSSTVFGAVVYVDCDATGSNNGTSWEDAYTSLATVLCPTGSPVSSGDEIWVAEGTYYPGTARTDSFHLQDGVSVYGGFTGAESYRWEADPITHVTVLSGDIDFDDAVCDPDDVRTVVVAHNVDGDMIKFNGFTVKHGYNEPRENVDCFGGCIYAYQSDIEFNQCIIEDGHAYCGAGIAVDHGSANFFSTIFRYNTTLKPLEYYPDYFPVSSGGGLFYYESSSATGAGAVWNCLFHDNSSSFNASPSDDYCGTGGAISAVSWALPFPGERNIYIRNCTIVNNTSDYYGATHADEAISNCIIRNNTATFDSVADELFSTSGTNITYSCVNNVDSTYMANDEAFIARDKNTSLDPQFTSVPNKDFTLNIIDNPNSTPPKIPSPCIDAGQNVPFNRDSAGIVEHDFDLANNNRCVESYVPHGYLDTDNDGLIDHAWADHTNDAVPFVVDMGCYECQYSRQLDGPAPKTWIRLVAGDTGISATDSITSNNNSTPGKVLTFQVNNVLEGPVSLVYNGDSIATDTVLDTEEKTWKTIVTDGYSSHTLAEGWQEISVESIPDIDPTSTYSAMRICVDTIGPQYVSDSRTINNGDVARSSIALMSFEANEDIFVDNTFGDVLTLWEYPSPWTWSPLTLSNPYDFAVDGNVIAFDIWSTGHQTVLNDGWYAPGLRLSRITDIAGNALQQPSGTDRDACRFFRFAGDATGEGAVDSADWNIMYANYNTVTDDWTNFVPGDFNLDGNVNVTDQIMVRGNYNLSVDDISTVYNAPGWPAN